VKFETIFCISFLAVPMNEKKIVFITARIHPGEPNSSYMMRGLLEFITSDEKIANVGIGFFFIRKFIFLFILKKLRSQLVFKIIPMLNPDGVIIGNYRCSLTGKDMNRNFRHPRKQTFPPIYHIKELIQNLQRDQHEVY
jgi:murein tripeptide amidase MpaA